MTFFKFTAPQTGQSYNYPTLGFKADDGAVLDGTASTPAITNPPDGNWAVVGAGPESGITRYSNPTAGTDYSEPQPGTMLSWDDAANNYLPTAPSQLVSSDHPFGVQLAAAYAAPALPPTAQAVRRMPDVDVRDYGAKVDGTTDDTAAIQAAMDAVKAAGGGVVRIPWGTAKIGQLLLRRNVHLRGANQFGTILKRIAGNGKTAMLKNGDTGTASADLFWTVSDLTLDGDKANDNTGAGVYLDNGTRPGTRWGPYGISPVCTLENLLITNMGQYGITTQDTHEVRFKSLFIIHCAAEGLAVNGADSNFIDLTVACCGTFNGHHNITISGAGNKFIGCRSWWPGREFTTDGGGQTVNASANAWHIDGSAAGVSTQITSLIGCLGQDGPNNGFYLYQASQVQMSGCESAGNANAAVLLDGAKDCDIDYRVPFSYDGWVCVNALKFQATTSTPARNRIRGHFAQGAFTAGQAISGTQTGGGVIVTPAQAILNYSRAGVAESVPVAQMRSALAALGLVIDNTTA